MIRRGNGTCASCEKFPRDAIEAARGVCAVKGYEFASDSPAGALHDLAGDHVQRREIVASLAKSQIVE